MKRVAILIFWLFCITCFFGCAKGVESCSVSPSGAESVQNIISSDMLGQGLYDALEKEWDTWNEKTQEQKLLSSHLPGNCYKTFETLEECEEFLGFRIYNPLENDTWTEKASYVGMPVGNNDAPRFYVSFYGENAEQVKWIFVDSGYRNGDVRITVNAQIYVDAPPGETDTQELLITEDSGGQYVANSVTIVRGPVIYNIRVIGELNHKGEVKETLEKVLECFADFFVLKIEHSSGISLLKYGLEKLCLNFQSRKGKFSPFANGRILCYSIEKRRFKLFTVLRGELAEQQSIFIMRTFREMRHYIKQNQQFVTHAELGLVTAKVSEVSAKVTELEKNKSRRT